MKSRNFLLIVLSLLLAASTLMCSLTRGAGIPTPPPTPETETHLQSTIESLKATVNAQEPESTEAAAERIKTTFAPKGSISGKLSYPSEAIPPLRIVAFQVGGTDWYSVDTPLNTFEYSLSDLPVGTYHVVAYVLPSSTFADLAGGYSQAIACGLTAECTDHSLVDVVVHAGEDTPNIDPGDWYAPEGSFPPIPVP